MTHPRRAFTLLELIVTIGIIAVLASLIIAALGGVSSAASRARSTNALREMVLAFNAYSGDHKQNLMPGYLSAERLEQLGIEATLETGVELVNGVGDPHDDASSYVWRLAPYLDHNWKTVLVDYGSRTVENRFDLEVRGASREPCDSSTEPVYGAGTADAEGCNDLGLAARPSFGMNSVYVGGDDVHGGAAISELNPWGDRRGSKLAATRLSEVKNPARLLVFAPCETATTIVDPPVSKVRFGDAALLPPDVEIDSETAVSMWRLGADNIIEKAGLGAFGEGGGWVIARWSKDELPVGRLDGSVQSIPILDLERDLRNWSPNEVGF